MFGETYGVELGISPEDAHKLYPGVLICWESNGKNYYLERYYVQKNPKQYLTHCAEEVRQEAKRLIPLKEKFDYYSRKVNKLLNFPLKVFLPLTILSIALSILVGYFISAGLFYQTLIGLFSSSILFGILNLIRFCRFMDYQNHYFKLIIGKK